MAPPPRIAVIGANGQVGAEVCLFLHVRDDVEVVPIARAPHSTVLLRRAGLACRHGAFARAGEATGLVADCDVVADFSWPRGRPDRIRQFVATSVVNAVREAPARSTHVLVSTQSVYRLGAAEPRYRIYARTKRRAETLAARWARRTGRPLFVLRLGQVHGLLQAVSHEILAGLRPGPTVVPARESFTVFAFTVAEALAHIAAGRERPGTYTLVSTPPWSWREVHGYYARRAGLGAEIVEEPVRTARWRPRASRLLGPAWRLALRYADLLDDLAYRVRPALAERAHAAHLRRRARQELGDGGPAAWRPYVQERPVPGRRLATLSDSRLTMAEPTARVEALLARLV